MTVEPTGGYIERLLGVAAVFVGVAVVLTCIATGASRLTTSVSQTSCHACIVCLFHPSQHFAIQYRSLIVFIVTHVGWLLAWKTSFRQFKFLRDIFVRKYASCVFLVLTCKL